MHAFFGAIGTKNEAVDFDNGFRPSTIAEKEIAAKPIDFFFAPFVDTATYGE
ncbi:MAG: hypothetical protein R3274_06905 [Desulfobacterales bacterium]|nr:hypothetical protein [Desulfobacterales bacterium]